MCDVPISRDLHFRDVLHAYPWFSTLRLFATFFSLALPCLTYENAIPARRSRRASSQGEILIGLLYVRVRVGGGRAPSESRWSLVLHLLENSPLFLQNIARGTCDIVTASSFLPPCVAVVQEVAVAKLVPIKLLTETMEVVQRQGSIKVTRS